MRNNNVKEGAQISKQQKSRLIEMSDGTLRVRSGWAYLYILPGMALLLLFTIYPLIMVPVSYTHLTLPTNSLV